MPIYESRCNKCGKIHDYIRTIANYLDTPECCGEKSQKVILSAPMGIVDIPAYESPATGKWITSRAERREDLKQSGCREWEGMANERQESERQKAYQAEAEDKSLDHAVRTAWQELPDSKKREALAATE
jgi:putative FmdB family regulatory protein